MGSGNLVDAALGLPVATSTPFRVKPALGSIQQPWGSLGKAALVFPVQYGKRTCFTPLG